MQNLPSEPILSDQKLMIIEYYRCNNNDDDNYNSHETIENFQGRVG